MFGSSILYGVSGTINFEDLKNLLFLTNVEYGKTDVFENYTFVKHIFLDGSLIQFALVFIFVSLLFKLAEGQKVFRMFQLTFRTSPDQL